MNINNVLHTRKFNTNTLNRKPQINRCNFRGNRKLLKIDSRNHKRLNSTSKKLSDLGMNKHKTDGFNSKIKNKLKKIPLFRDSTLLMEKYDITYLMEKYKGQNITIRGVLEKEKPELLEKYNNKEIEFTYDLKNQFGVVHRGERRVNNNNPEELPKEHFHRGTKGESKEITVSNLEKQLVDNTGPWLPTAASRIDALRFILGPGTAYVFVSQHEKVDFEDHARSPMGKHLSSTAFNYAINEGELGHGNAENDQVISYRLHFSLGQALGGAAVPLNGERMNLGFNLKNLSQVNFQKPAANPNKGKIDNDQMFSIGWE